MEDNIDDALYAVACDWSYAVYCMWRRLTAL